MAKFAGVVCLVLICMVVVAPHAMAITCDQVGGYLIPCIPYVTKGGAVPPAGCCNGIRSLNAAAKTTADRQATCVCLKKLAQSFKNTKPGLVSGLPGKCGVSVPYPISPSTDCSKVK